MKRCFALVPALLGGCLLFACEPMPEESSFDGSRGLDGSTTRDGGTVTGPVDGGPDAEAPACTPSPEGSPATCSDGCDNDADGATDCADDDCAAEPACVPPPACPLPTRATRAFRDDPDPVQVQMTVDSSGRLTSVEGVACEEIEPRPRITELYQRPPRCVASYRCGGCVWTFRNESAVAEGSQTALYLWSDRETDDAPAPACPSYSSELYTLDVLGNPYDRGPSDPWRDCAALGGVEGPTGACLITDCSECPSDAACLGGALAFCHPSADCTRDLDCPEGWQCQEFAGTTRRCRIPCTTTTTGGSAECPSNFRCTDDTAVGRDNHWCVDPNAQQRVCDQCLDACRDLPEVTNCCCGSGCICESECMDCTYF